MATRAARLPNWLAALLPLGVIAALVAVFLASEPISRLREVPPVEAIAVERTVLDPNEITMRIRNDGPDPVTIAQVLVDDAYWNHTIGDRELGRLEATTVTIPYPWDAGLPVNIAFVTSTGLTIEHDIEAAALTPEVDATTLGIYALLGIYIGVIPVAVGLLWFGALTRASDRWIAFFLALTAGLLVFLLVDTVSEGIEIAGTAGAALDGIGLFAIGALGAVLALNWLSSYLSEQRGARTGLVVAYLIATGIGLHNLGEGLAVGAALATGEIALGTFLVIGFALHNTTEGLAIVAPLGAERTRPSLWHFVALGAVAGIPTIAGAWIGGYAFSPGPASLAFGLAAGAIAQVVWAIGKTMPRERGYSSGPGALGFVAGLLIMYVTGLFAA
ncbi:MAG: ZIP family metal transporter [Actinomycetota bacterium]|nr:ZIP family metal transporter [Actinomycetota bacterium]